MASTSDRDSLVFLGVRLKETVERCEQKNIPCFFGFLTQEQQQVAFPIVSKTDGGMLWGGHPDAERQMVGFFPDYLDPCEEEFPIVTIGLSYREVASISHRDVLGALLSLGIKREAVGDILCGKGLSVVFLRQEIADFVVTQLEKIGREGITVLRDYTGPLPLAHVFYPVRETVASPRLDGVVKALIRCSREEAARLITVGSVSLNHCVTENVSATVNGENTVSIRGFGRFRIDQIGPETKKGRLVLLASRYG